IDNHEAYLARWRYRRDFDLLPSHGRPQPGQVALEEAANDVAEVLKRKPEAVDSLLVAADLERLRARAAVEDAGRPVEEREQALKDHREKASLYLARGLEQAKKGPAGNDGAHFQLLWHKANLLLDEIDRQDNNPTGTGRTSPERAAAVAEVRQTILEVRKT